VKFLHVQPILGTAAEELDNMSHRKGNVMKAQLRNMEVASFLSDIEEEFSAERLRGYTDEVTPHLPKKVREDIEEACKQLVKAKARIHQAVEHLSKKADA
jgi:hypothetical protein